MTPKKRFLLGGIGAILPVFISLITIDIASSLYTKFTAIFIVGLLLRYFFMFLIGGFVSYLHDDENKPFKLVELGIAAPALLSSIISANSVKVDYVRPHNLNTTTYYSLPFISEAEADDIEKNDVKPSKEELIRALMIGIIGATATLIINNNKDACGNVTKLSEDADVILRLISNKNTIFYVNGTVILDTSSDKAKICINSKTAYKIDADSELCDIKTVYIQPPYDDPLYAFYFLDSECHQKNRKHR